MKPISAHNHWIKFSHNGLKATFLWYFLFFLEMLLKNRWLVSESSLYVSLWILTVVMNTHTMDRALVLIWRTWGWKPALLPLVAGALWMATGADSVCFLRTVPCTLLSPGVLVRLRPPRQEVWPCFRPEDVCHPLMPFLPTVKWMSSALYGHTTVRAFYPIMAMWVFWHLLRSCLVCI